MGKKQAAQTKEIKAKETKTAIDSTAALPAFLRATGPTSCSIAIHAKPGAKASSISLSEEAVDVSIDAPAREGEANAAILEYVADLLGLKKRHVSLAVGGRSREKVLAVDGLDAHAALARLQEHCSGG